MNTPATTAPAPASATVWVVVRAYFANFGVSVHTSRDAALAGAVAAISPEEFATNWASTYEGRRTPDTMSPVEALEFWWGPVEPENADEDVDLIFGDGDNMLLIQRKPVEGR